MASGISLEQVEKTLRVVHNIDESPLGLFSTETDAEFPLGGGVAKVTTDGPIAS